MQKIVTLGDIQHLSHARIYKGKVLTPLAPETPDTDYQTVTDLSTDTYAVT